MGRGTAAGDMAGDIAAAGIDADTAGGGCMNLLGGSDSIDPDIGKQ